MVHFKVIEIIINNKPPTKDGKFDANQYQDATNLIIDKFDYDNPNYTRENHCL